VFFSVGEGPVEAHNAAAVLQGEVPTPEAIREAAETAGDSDVDPQSDINASAEYRRHLVKVLGQRALAQAFLRAQDRSGA
jgi:CO/xanthine dehydrogenase FAD-binding subunit